MNSGIVSTIGQKCRRCYSCVRECPAKAIRVFEGQAFVLSNRCISCGHCVKVCSLEAKHVASDVDPVQNFLIPNFDTVAIIAPSFVAAYPENYRKIPTVLRYLGFQKVFETAFGADLVSQEYEKYFESKNDRVIISSPCPAIYNYIEKYFEDLVDNLAQIVSPMIAMGRYIKNNFDEKTKVVFIGPCIAKKSEYMDDEVDDAVDAVLTFTELDELIEKNNIDLDDFENSHFDPPYANLGKSYPLSGGLLKSASFKADLLEKEVIVVDGKEKVVELIEDISQGKIKSKFIDILFCEGCISGPGLDTDLNYYARREKIIEYIEENLTHVDKKIWKSDIYNSRDLNLSRNFSSKLQRIPMPDEDQIKDILARTNKFSKKDELNCGSCGYATCREYAISIAKGIAEEEMCLPYLIEKMEKAYSELKDTQLQLHNAEKLASIGQLAAGVAHEINNPLGTILLYASMLREDIERIKTDSSNAEDIKMIIEETNRCKGIVSNLLNFARQGKLRISNANIISLMKDTIKIVKLNEKFSDIKIDLHSDLNQEFLDFDTDQIKQVFLNLLNNACEAVEYSQYKSISVFFSRQNDHLKIRIKDTGCGIKNENIKKLFTPFFTTKKIGKGTGLGLAISYGIIKMHKGNIGVESIEGKGSEFIIELPITEKNNIEILKEINGCR